LRQKYYLRKAPIDVQRCGNNEITLTLQAHNRLPIDLLAPLIAVFWWFDQGRFVLPAIMKKLPI